MPADMFKVIVLACVSVATAQNADDSKLVTIAQGPVLGHKNPDHDIFEFMGIPYATAPTGTQRYTAPLPAPSWSETLDAVDRGIICPQNPRFFPQNTMQEDCLIANIYTPDTNEINLPVLVVVHGGAYVMGYGNEWAPRRIAGTKKLVAVTFNYRLGAHGFLCLGTKDVPGNAGMKDQVALLRWVQSNIANFGGNPNNVTISGYSAGASSVDLLMISKSAEGLFHKAIPESGANVASWSAHPHPVQSAKDYAKLLNFANVDDMNALEEFYKTISYETLFSSVEFVERSQTLFFSPCIENDLEEEVFMNESPVSIIEEERYNKVPLLYGFTDMEGILRITKYDDWFQDMNEHFSDYLPDDLQFNSIVEREAVAQTIKNLYFGNNRIGIATIFGYINYFTDSIFAYPMLRSAKLQVETGHDALYLYQYAFFKKFPSVPGVSDALINRPGASHCDQTFAILDNTLDPTPEDLYSEEYIQMRETMIELWTNFIVTGQPVPEGSSLPAWPPVTANRTPHMHLGETIELRDTPIMADRAQLWDDIYDRYYRHPGPPYSGASVISHTLVVFIITAVCLIQNILP